MFMNILYFNPEISVILSVRERPSDSVSFSRASNGITLTGCPTQMKEVTISDDLLSTE